MEVARAIGHCLTTRMRPYCAENYACLTDFVSVEMSFYNHF